MGRFVPAGIRLARLISVGHPGGCWLWMGRLDRQGYGYFNAQQRSVSAYSFTYQQIVGPIPDGLELDHTCRVRDCVNPDHLEPVTHAENMRRAAEAHVACGRGHPWDEANTFIWRGDRICRRCSLDRQAALRGVGPTVEVLAACRKGHSFDEANTYRDGGSRHCRACGRDRTRAYRARKAA